MAHSFIEWITTDELFTKMFIVFHRKLPCFASMQEWIDDELNSSTTWKRWMNGWTRFILQIKITRFSIIMKWKRNGVFTKSRLCHPRMYGRWMCSSMQRNGFAVHCLFAMNGSGFGLTSIYINRWMNLV